MSKENRESFAEREVMLNSIIKSKALGDLDKRLQELKEEKNPDKLRTSYDEIINEVLQERSKAVMIAQHYKSDLENIVINDSDIDHLQKTLQSFFDLIIQSYEFELDPQNEEHVKMLEAYRQGLNSLSKMVNANNMKTLLLMGFDFKEAIGRPMTELCAQSIRNSMADEQEMKKNEEELKESIRQPLIQILVGTVKHFVGKLSGAGDKEQ